MKEHVAWMWKVVGLVVLVGVLPGMHCSRLCREYGPDHDTVVKRQEKGTGSMRFKRSMRGEIEALSIIVRHREGIVVTSCASPPTELGRTTAPGTLALDKALDCFVISPVEPTQNWEIDLTVRSRTVGKVGGGRGEGVHGQQCYPFDLDYKWEFEPVVELAPEDYGRFEEMDAPWLQQWVAQQNGVTRKHLDVLPSRERFHAGITKYIDTARITTPIELKAALLYMRKVPGKPLSVLIRAKSIGQSEEVILDPNTWSEDGTVSLSDWMVSHGERYLTYGVSVGGSDWHTWKVLDLQTLKDLPDELRGLKWETPNWAPNDVGLFYSGYPDRTHAESAAGTANQVYYHSLGTTQAEDVAVYKPEDDKWIAAPAVYEAQDILEIRTYKSSDGRNRIQLHALKPGWNKDPASIGAATSHVLSPHFGWRMWGIAASAGKHYAFSEENAPRGSVVVYDVTQQTSTTLIPEREHPLVNVQRVGDLFFAEYIEDVESYVLVYDLAGKRVDEIRMGFPSNLWGFGRGRSWHKQAYFGAEGYATPYSIYRYAFDSKKHAPVWRLEIPFDANEFETKRVFYGSKDGTKVPMFVVRKKSTPLDGKRPTMLLGYGCYGYLLPIHFRSSLVPWLEAGGVYAVANIRGGGAYGEAWHRAGQRENKQNSIDDFIAGAEYLQANGYTSPKQLTINGASCGGLLVGATVTQRPELFAAAIPEVGIFDLLRFHKFSGAYLWEDELGSPDVPAQRAYLEKLSPLIAAQQRRSYPAMLITTRKKDTRVVPMNAYKFAAALQDHQTGSAPILLRVDETGGHSLGALPLPMQVDYLADVYAFAWEAAQ